MNFEIYPQQLSEPFSVTNTVGESILAERVYRDFPFFVIHKSTMTDLIIVRHGRFLCILGMDWLHACYVLIECRT